MSRDEPDEEPWLPGAPTCDGSWDRLAGRVYVGMRDGSLSPEAAFDLAVFLKDWAKPHPVFEALAAASIGAADHSSLTGLAREALAVVQYVPGFRVEPRLLEVLDGVLEVLTHDLRATGLAGHARAVLPDDADLQNAWVQYQGSFSHTSGLAPRDVSAGGPELLMLVADELQDAVTESLAGVWPVCPQHQLGAHPRVSDGQAAWWCSGGGGHVIFAVGHWNDRSTRPQPRRRPDPA
jgi:hypothetical protein